MEWADGMLYPILHRLEKRDLIESYWGQGETGRKRKYYRLRREGAKALQDQRQAFEKVYALLQDLKGPESCPA
ncbi:MAG: helix-turn-helix transcriptional regulator, partial [Planctomycetota bacterium]